MARTINECRAATARELEPLRVKVRRTQCEQISSGLPLKADVSGPLRTPQLPETAREGVGATLDERVALPLGSYQVAACDLLDKLDDASPQPWLLYPHERLSEREPVGRGEEV